MFLIWPKLQILSRVQFHLCSCRFSWLWLLFGAFICCFIILSFNFLISTWYFLIRYFLVLLFFNFFFLILACLQLIACWSYFPIWSSILMMYFLAFYLFINFASQIFNCCYIVLQLVCFWQWTIDYFQSYSISIFSITILAEY